MKKTFIYYVFQSFARCEMSAEEGQLVLTALKASLILSPSNASSDSLEGLYQAGIKIANQQRDEDSRDAFKAMLAEHYYQESLKSDLGTAKANYLKQAITIYQNMSNTKDRCDELNKELREVRKTIPAEMQGVKLCTDDITPAVASAINHISGVEFEECLIKWLLLIHELPTYERMKPADQTEIRHSMVEDSTKEYYDDTGKTIYKEAGNEEINVENKILRDFKDRCDRYARTYIIPCLVAIDKQHVFSWEKILEFIKESPFIPPQHHIFFAKGLNHFLRFEMMEAVTLMAPQIEACLRHLLSDVISTDVIHANGLEGDVIDCEKLLNSCLEQELLSNTYCYYFKTILTHPIYSLRHDIAHGKANDTVGDHYHAYVFCFLVFYLVMLVNISPYYKTNGKLKKITQTIPSINKYKSIIDSFLLANNELLGAKIPDVTFISKLANCFAKEFIKHNVSVGNAGADFVLEILHTKQSNPKDNKITNLFICEAKKDAPVNKTNIETGKQRLVTLTSDKAKNKYDIACFLVVDINTQVITSFWYENGKEITVIRHEGSRNEQKP